jgi:hypothetical protein
VAESVPNSAQGKPSSRSGDDELPIGDDGAERFALANDGTETEQCRLADASGDWRADTAAFDLIAETFDAGIDGTAFGFDLGNFRLNALEAGFAITIASKLILRDALCGRFQSGDSATQAADLRLRLVEVALRGESFLNQLLDPSEFKFGVLSGRFGFADLVRCFFGSATGGGLFLLTSTLFSGELGTEALECGIRPEHAHLFLPELKLIRLRVDFNKDVAELHILAHADVGFDDLAGER